MGKSNRIRANHAEKKIVTPVKTKQKKGIARENAAYPFFCANSNIKLFYGIDIISHITVFFIRKSVVLPLTYL